LLQASAVAASANLVLFFFQPLLGDPLLLVVMMIFSSFPTHNKEDLLQWCQRGATERGRVGAYQGRRGKGEQRGQGAEAGAVRRRRRGYRRLKS